MSGRIIVMGSGEMAPGLVATHRAGIAAAAAGRVVVIDSPFGFQENAGELTDKLSAFFGTSLNVPTDVATLRRRNATDSEVARFIATVRSGRYVFAGPGSPSYALSIWRDIGIGSALIDVVGGGGTLTFASAAALTLGRTTIPVYEIYKVGDDPRWLEGLDLLTHFGLPCTVVPHWNNAEGGTHDTSRCYIGERRLGELSRQLDVGILGVDEHTAATIDFAAGTLAVTGRGTVTLRGSGDVELASGETISLEDAASHLGPPDHQQEPPQTDQAETSFADALSVGDADGLLGAVLVAEAAARDDDAARLRLRSMLVDLVEAARDGLADPRTTVGGYVELLLELRTKARDAGDYRTSDTIRDGLTELGVEVRDTPEGAEWHLQDSEQT